MITIPMFSGVEGSLLTRDRWNLILSDATKTLTMLGDECVSLVVTDPAYESLEKHRKIGTTTRLKADWFDVVPNSYFPRFFAECYRVLAPNSHLYFICDSETMFAVKPMAEAAGFKFWKPIVWSKVKMGMGYHYRASCEFVLFFEKGKRRLSDMGVKDVLEIDEVISCPRVNGYPTEKPVELSRILIRQSAAPGGIVVDPFCGSGSVGEAALLEGRRFFGSDLSPRAIEVASKRLGSVP